MPFSFDVDERSGVLHIHAFGRVDDLELRDLSERLQHEVAYVSGYPIFCDCSAVTLVLVSSGLIEALAKFARPRTNFVAVIAPSAVVFGLARMYQVFTDPECARIRVFAGAAEAMAWFETVAAGLTHHA